jgi:hypothetical protein
MQHAEESSAACHGLRWPGGVGTFAVAPTFSMTEPMRAPGDERFVPRRGAVGLEPGRE